MKKETFLVLVFLGSLWGAVEVFLGDFLYSIGAFHPSIILTSIAFGILAFGRKYYRKAGSSTIIGAIAVLFRLTNASPHYCHLFAIFLDGVAFDLMATLLVIRIKQRFIQRGIIGSLSAYAGYSLFGLVMSYIVHYPHWVRIGLPGILNYVGFRGSLTAMGSFFTVPLGYLFAEFLKGKALRILKLKPTQVCGLFGLATAFLWVVGRLT